MQKSTNRILTTHTGSLPRPQALLDMIVGKYHGGQGDAAAFQQAVQAATSDVVQRQIDCGLDIINDGETSKISYNTYVTERLNGFNGRSSTKPGLDLIEHPEYGRRMFADEGMEIIKSIPACDGPVSWKDREAVDLDIQNFKQALEGREPADCFMTSASPGVIALFMHNQYYPGERDYLYALADVMREEYEAIANAGFVLQLDCPDLACGRHTQFAGQTLAEFIRTVELHIEVINHAVRNIPADRVRMHLCWGNYGGPHNHDVPLRDILGPVLQANVGAISFEAANPRHEHEWSLFKEVSIPGDKVLIPGVIDTSTNYIEHPELVAERIVRIAELVGPEKVIAGCDCGFATFATSLEVVPSIAWAKLGSLAEGARIASGRLFGK